MSESDDINPSVVLTDVATRVSDKIGSSELVDVVSRDARLIRVDREQVQSIREGLAERGAVFRTTLAHTEQMQLAVIDMLPDDQHEFKSRAKEGLTQNLLQLQKAFSAEQLAHEDTVEFAIGSSLEAYFDSNTALLAKKAMIRTCSHLLVTERQKQIEDPNYEPYKVYFEIGDGMLFHAGNELRSSSGFDDALRSETRAQIALARYFSKEYCPYSPYESEDAAVQDPDLRRFVLDVPANKALFDQLRELQSQEGNRFEYYEVRVNAGGGDEFLRAYHVKGPDSDQMVAVARALTIGITRSQVLSPEYDVLTGQERELSEREIDRRLKIAHGLRKSPEAFKVAYGKDSALLRQFVEFYGEHLFTQTNDSIIQNSQYDVCFDMAIYERNQDSSDRKLPNAEDAIMHFVTGTDAEGNRLKKGSGDPVYGLYDESGKPDDAKIEAYADSLAQRIQSILRPDDYNNVVKVQSLIRELLLEDIYTSFADHLNDQVNAVAKPIKKLSVLYDAYLHKKRNPRSLFAVGATVATGRPKFVDLSNQEKAELTITLIQDFEEECASRPDDESLIHASQYWNRIKENYVKTPNKEGVLPGYDSAADIDYAAILGDYSEMQAERRTIPRKPSI